jgi:hypothetical protein
MRITVPSAILFLSLSTSTLAASGPQLVVDRPEFDFGTVTEGKKVTHVFVLNNNGTAPIVIKRTRTSCGCTVANASSPIIQPGKKAEIKAAFDSTNFSGNVKKIVTVESNDPKKPQYELVLKGSVAAKINIMPARADFGTVKAGSAKELTLTVENRMGRPLRIKSVTSSLPQVTARAPHGTVQPWASARIIVKAAPRNEDRLMSGFLNVVTDSPIMPLIVVPLYGSVVR